jgi:UDP-glucose 4-epimerase
MSAGGVLVTGGCGFIGARLCARLVAAGHDVTVIDRRASTEASMPPRDDMRMLQIDIRDVHGLTRCLAECRPRTVFHLAAVHFIPDCTARPLDCFGVNVAGTQAVLSACADTPGVETVVLASSAAVYRPSEAPHDEESPLGPTDIYGYGKFLAEQLTHLLHAQRGVGVGIARLFNVFGPGDTTPHLIPAIIDQARRGCTLRLGALSTARDYVYVDDVADGLVRLATMCRGGKSLTCNFGSGRAVDGWSLIRLVETATGKSLDVEQDPGRLRASDRPMLLGDCARAHTLLGWRAETTLEAGMAEALRHARGGATIAERDGTAQPHRRDTEGSMGRSVAADTVKRAYIGRITATDGGASKARRP